MNIVKFISILLQITSSWQEHCDVEYSRGIQVDMTARERSCNSTVYTLFLHHDVDKSKSAETPVLNVTLPEMFHVTVKADDTSLNFRRKIMGDVYVDCNSGDVCIDQLRGENIHLHCNSGEWCHIASSCSLNQTPYLFVTSYHSIR